MSDLSIRDADARDFTAIVALNDAEVSHTSPMDEDRLAHLHALAYHHRVADIGGRVAAFLLAMQQGCGYRNDNFEWFSSRIDSFLYVDRIVVDARDRGSRLGTLLYEDLFDHARRIGVGAVVCEYNLVPPNEPSRRFHDAFGFHEAGRQWSPDGAKQVSMQVATVDRVASQR
jgi:predicted GNAT superfamily acetyltransferase